jgi:putative component of toxin-antitoxin plasmid stabilization module
MRNRSLNGFDTNATARVTTALTRIDMGNFSNVKGVGAGVLNARSTSAPVTVFTSARMATGL